MSGWTNSRPAVERRCKPRRKPNQQPFKAKPVGPTKPIPESFPAVYDGRTIRTKPGPKRIGGYKRGMRLVG